MLCADHSTGAFVSTRRCAVRRTRPGITSGQGYRDDPTSRSLDYRAVAAGLHYEPRARNAADVDVAFAYLYHADCVRLQCVKRWAAARSGAPSTGRRDLRIDAVRGVALVLMYLAHCAPSPGPAEVLNLSEYATYPLFALLVGIGAALGSRSASRRWWVGPLVRGAVLVAVGEVLEEQHTQVWIVLGFLGS